MRPSLLPGLLDGLGHNRRRQRRDVQLFEIGCRMTASRGETRTVALAWTGAAVAEHWSDPGRPATFFDLRGSVEQVMAALGVRPSFRAAAFPSLVAGRAAEIVAEGAAGAVPAGSIGQLLPQVAESHGLPPHDEVFVAEIDLDAIAPLADLGEDVRVQPLPRHPAVVRDLSVLVSVATPAETLRRTIETAAPPTLERVTEFARYDGKGVPEGQVSLSFRLVFRASDRTLTDAEVHGDAEAILAALAAAHGARLR
jgi:phenylalanyl-tRNA synthetase beta chain